MKIFNKVITISVILCLALSFGACSHTCSFDKQTATETYFVSEATCTESAKYYKSCSCGAKGVETFSYGEPLGHEYNWWSEDGNGKRVRQCSRDSSHTVSQRLDAWNDDGVLKILAVGNSFSVDSMEYVYDIALEAGAERVALGNLYIGSCTLEKHYNNTINNSREYTYYTKDRANDWQTLLYRSLNEAVASDEWDFITFQQGSVLSGDADSYDYLKKLIGVVKPLCTNPNVQFGWHMTWAYQGDSSRYPKYYADQDSMYQLIVGAVQSKVMTNEDICLIIPNGTAIQNARSSYVGDTFTRDGHHLAYNEGRFLAGVTTVASLIGIDYDNIDLTLVCPSSLDAKFCKMVLESVKNAIENPLQKTQSQMTE